jgi:hypothetical protein
LNGAKIGSDLDCAGATFENRTQDGSSYALAAASAEVGNQFIMSGTRASGEVSLIGARIRGDLDCINATFENRTEGGDGSALNAQRAEITGIAFLRGANFRASGRVGLEGVRIGGDLDCTDATFDNRREDGAGEALTATNAEIGNFVFSGAKASGQVSLIGTKIRGDLNCIDATFENRAEDGDGHALNVQRAEIAGVAFLRGPNFKASGKVDLEGARINGDLDCDRAYFENGSANAFVAINTELGTHLLLRRVVVIGGIILSGSRIGRNLDLRGSRLLSPRSYAITAINLHVTGRIILGPAIVLGDLSFQHTEVAGGLDWTRLQLPRECTYNGELYQARAGRSRLSLANANIGTELRAERLTSEIGLDIDLAAHT